MNHCSSKWFKVNLGLLFYYLFNIHKNRIFLTIAPKLQQILILFVIDFLKKIVENI